MIALTADDPAVAPPAAETPGETPAADRQESGQRVIAGSLPDGELTRIEPLNERPAPPSTIEIADAGLDGEIEAVGDARDGIVIPDPERAGWYRFGPRPGESGRAIIVGHINSVEGPALFSALGAAEAGAEVVVTDRAGERHVYRVTDRLQVAKAEFPAERIYGPSGRAELVLITCGGDYDAETGFEDNVVVFARAVD